MVAAEAEPSTWIAVAVVLGLFGLFGLFGLAVWRSADPARWGLRDPAPVSARRSARDQFRSIVFGALIAGVVLIGFPSVVAYWLDVGNDHLADVLAVAGVLVLLLGLAIWTVTARCRETGKRIIHCHCPYHSGE